MPVGQAAERLVVNEDLTSGRLVEPADKLQQSTFARAASASDGYEFAGKDVKVDTLQRRDDLATDTVRLGKVGDGDVAAAGAFWRGSGRCYNLGGWIGFGGWRQVN